MVKGNILDMGKCFKNIMALHLFYFLFFSQLCFPQVEVKEGPPEPIILLNADNLVGSGKEGERQREFIGNVRFQQGIVFVSSNKAIQYLDENRATLSGNVIIRQEDLLLKSSLIHYDGNSGIAYSPTGIEIKDKNMRLKADSGTYNTRTYEADFFHDVSVTDDTVSIRADHIRYNRKTRVSFAFGNIHIDNDSVQIICDSLEHRGATKDSYASGNVLVKAKFTNVLLVADSIIHIQHQKYTKAIGQPVLIQIDTIKSYTKGDTSKENSDTINVFKYDSLIVTSILMDSKRDGNQEIYNFIGNVEIIKGHISARAGRAIYNKSEEEFRLYELPILWYDSTQLHADSIVIQTQNNKLKLVLALSNAFAGSKDDTLDAKRINQISGDELKMFFENDSIKLIASYGNSKSLYFIYADSSAEGVDRTGADTILFVNFSENKPENIIWLGSIVGEAFPENMVTLNPTQYYLPSFRWSELKPIRKEIKIRKEK